MAKKMRRITALILAVAMMMGFSITASAVRADLEDILYGDPVVSKTTNQITKKTTLNEKGDIPLGIKTAEKQDGFGYEVEIAVPGNAEDIHDEIIIMMDGSNSGNDEWPNARAAILEIAERVLGGTGRTQLTVMAFGMDSNIFLEHVSSVEELDKVLPAEYPEGLLYGRSATNCEVGFTGLMDYIAADEDLNDAFVFYITDGRINTDETPLAFFPNWRDYATMFGPMGAAQGAFEASVYYADKLPEAFTTVFGDRFDGATPLEILNRAFGGEVTDAEFYAYYEQIWADVYAYHNMDLNGKYATSDVEYAFVRYDEVHGTYIQDTFYYSIYKSTHADLKYPNATKRAAKAGTELASMVKQLYMIDTDNINSWMDPASSAAADMKVTGSNVSFAQVSGLNNFDKIFADVLDQISLTGYTNVVITDYMSKWVNLDTDSIRVVNDTTGEVIWTAKDGWAPELEEADRPTEKNPVVSIELVPADQYEAGGADVIGNTSGDIYKLTWNVKDDSLLRTDSYSLRYNVTVDVEEEGFNPNADHPANGNTYVTYDDGGYNEIEVPDVNIPAYTVRYETTQETLQETEDLFEGDIIPGYLGEEPEKDGFAFTGWKLTSGTPDGSKIGTTDLVYTAQFELLPGEDETIIEDEEVPLAPIPSLFSDDHYAYIIGYPDGLVHPEANITRAEVATIFFRLLDDDIRKAEMVSENQFTDVHKGQWYNNAVSTLASMGILLGKGDGSYFAPDDFITRAEFAAIAARFDPTGSSEGDYFDDIAGHWAEDEIIVAANNGWVKGENGKFRPDDYITRAEAVTLINRVLHRLPETKEDLLPDMVIWPDNMDEAAWYYLAMQEATNSHLYERKPNPDYETWTEFREPYDWSLLEY